MLRSLGLALLCSTMVWSACSGERPLEAGERQLEVPKVTIEAFEPAVQEQILEAQRLLI